MFTKANLRHFALDLLYQSGTHYTLVDSNQNRLIVDYTLVDSNQNRCMYFLVAKQPNELAVKLSEVWIRILINDIVSISNDPLIDGEYGLSSRKEKRALCLGSSVQFVKSFSFDSCKLLKANAFVYMYEKFESNVHYCANTLKIVNKHYLDYCKRKYNK